jgi:hypothetical protein
MSAPYVAACLMACLMLMGLVFYAVWKMGKLNNLKITAQIAKVFSLSFEATSDITTRMIDDGDSHHDPQLSFADVEHVAGYPAGPRAG